MNILDAMKKEDQLGRTFRRGSRPPGIFGYWEARRHMLYYKSLFQFVSVAGDEAKSRIDVGCASARYINWFGWIPNRSLLDFKIPAKPDGVECLEIDFEDFEPDQLFDLALCCQVLEHVDDPVRFCGSSSRSRGD